eukprot:COSAG01_NODE_20795_length_934_cov_20.525749_1_plen_105_part_00
MARWSLRHTRRYHCGCAHLRSQVAQNRRVAAGQTWCLGEGVVLGCWDTRELAHDIRAMLAYRGVVYEDRRYQVKAFLCNRRCTVPMTTRAWRWMEGSHASRAAR